MTSSEAARIGRFLMIGVTSACLVSLLAACSLFGPSPKSSATASHSAPTPTATTETPSPSPTSVAFVTIAQVTVDGGNLAVGGFVTGLSESGGACTFLISSTSSGAVVKVKSTGIQNSATTSCGTQLVPIAEVPRGAWTVVLDYSSSDLDVKSAAVKVEVP